MTPTPAAALAEELLPLRDIPHYAGGQWLQFLEEYNKNIRAARVAVTAALQAKDDKSAQDAARIATLEVECARLRVSADIARECFLNVLADAGENFSDHADGDAHDDGTPFVIRWYTLESHALQFEELCEALEIKPPNLYDDTWMAAIQRAIAEPPKAKSALQESGK